MSKIPTFGYSKSGEAQIFELDPGEALPAGWFDAPQAVAEAPAEAVPVAEPVHDHEVTELDALRARATELGIRVDGRWSVKKLHAIIAAEEEPDGDGN